MSKRKGKTNTRLAVLNEIDKIDKRLKRKKIREDNEETAKLISQRNTLKNKLRTKKSR